MSDDLICTWLRLPAGNWPPDHYVLLGLPPGEGDHNRIQAAVHERLEWLRCYQLTHPDQVTAAMNRLAQAFTCLTDPDAKKAYDAELFPETIVAPSEPALTAAPAVPAVVPSSADPLGWLFGPWNESAGTPVEATAAGPAPVSESAPAALPQPANGTAQPTATAVSTPPAPEPAPKAVFNMAHSAAAQRGLGTRRALAQRIAQTRQLLAAWRQVGKHLGDSEHKLTRRSEAIDLVQQLAAIREGLRQFPPLLGQAGQPGYSVIALARQQQIVQTFQGLLPSQRLVLAQHWQTGLDLLTTHRRFLRDEWRQRRRQGPLVRTACACQHWLLEHPGPWLILLGLLALNLAYPPLVSRWFLQIPVVLALVLIDWALRGNQTHRSWLDRSPPAD